MHDHGMVTQEPQLKLDSPIGNQLEIIGGQITALENVASALKTRTSAYCIPLSAGIVADGSRDKAAPRDVSQLESLLKLMAGRLEKIGAEIEAITRGLQI